MLDCLMPPIPAMQFHEDFMHTYTYDGDNSDHNGSIFE